MPEFPLLEGGEIDRRLSLRPGSAIRLARRQQLPHILLPDGSIRFNWPDVANAIRLVDRQDDNEWGSPHA